MRGVLSSITAVLLSLAFAAEARAIEHPLSGHQFRSGQDLLTQVNGFLGETRQERLSGHEPCAAAIGRFEKDVFMKGTGVVAVSPRIVLTNAHIVTKDGQVKRRVSFELPAGNGFNTYPGTVVSVGTISVGRAVAILDWAIIVLDSNASATPLALAFPRSDQLPRFSGRLFMISYSRFPNTLPGSGEEFPVVSRACTIHDDRLGYRHDCSAMEGGSGAPILVRENNWCTIFGLHQGAFRPPENVYPDRENVPYKKETANIAVSMDMLKDGFMRVLAAVQQGIPVRDMIKKAH